MAKATMVQVVGLCLMATSPSLAQGNGAVSLLEQGAKCDGVTDDTVAFETSFKTALAKLGGGVIAVPAGRCVVSTPLTLAITGDKSLLLRGEGRDVSEIVWSGNTDGLKVTLLGVGFAWLRSVASPAPVFHMDGLSLVSDGPGIGGTALTITSNAISNAASGGGLAPMVGLHDIGVHGTLNGQQGWHDGVAISNLPSGIRWDDGYILLVNGPPPWNTTGNGISIRGGSEDADGCVAMVSALYYLSRINIGGADHAIDIGSGVQDVDMDLVGGGGNWFTWAYQRAGCGMTATIRIANSNQTGYYGSVHVENIDTVFLTNNEPQAYQLGTAGSPYVPYTAFDFVGSIVHNGSPGSVNIVGNKILGSLSHGGQPWIGISIDKKFDVIGAFNPTTISSNTISLMNLPVRVMGQARNTLLVGNHLDNWSGNVPYLFAQDGNYAATNVLNGVLEGVGTSAPVQMRGAVTFDGPVTMPATAGSDPHVKGQLYFDAHGFVRRSGG